MMHGCTERMIESQFGISHSSFHQRKKEIMQAVILTLNESCYAIRFVPLVVCVHNRLNSNHNEHIILGHLNQQLKSSASWANGQDLTLDFISSKVVFALEMGH